MDFSLISTLIIVGFFCFFALILGISSLISFFEREGRAGTRMLILGLVFVLLAYFLGAFGYQGKSIIAIIFLVFSVITTFLFLKKPLKQKTKTGAPKRSVDEHDVIFSRMRLEPGTSDWVDYYSSHPLEAKQDTIARSLPGLL